MTKEILVIDDNLDIRQLISVILKDQGLKVREAANFDQAILEIDKKLPDVAIIDVKLDKGDNDGIDLLVHLKKIDDDIPVIMISGHANVQMAVDSLKLGAFEFIQKPFSSERLLNFLNRAIENVDLKKEKNALENKLFQNQKVLIHIFVDLIMHHLQLQKVFLILRIVYVFALQLILYQSLLVQKQKFYSQYF